ncbi:hypothetical protein NDU88_001925 [Pleurodeles waltl]|uniref:Uncharacterized protein n=1 Tax=Pleurodeles waltl TaxID=8319 RepID=A0AAV7W2H0_PLEWA|nr:hypothetical protein NDU88_001925 [Pleurodeles waltl]
MRASIAGASQARLRAPQRQWGTAARAAPPLNTGLSQWASAPGAQGARPRQHLPAATGRPGNREPVDPMLAELQDYTIFECDDVYTNTKNYGEMFCYDNWGL